MSFPRWLRPLHHVLAIFLCIMLVCGCALAWLGWKLLAQERSLESQRVQERLERAADHVAAVIQHSLLDLENYLSVVPDPGGKKPPGGVAILLETKDATTINPPGRLVFYPVVPGGEEPPDTAFAEGEKLEFQGSDPAKAAGVFGELARSANPGMRAGALLRLGRNLRKVPRNEEALQAYGELAQLGATPVLGLPAELQAREARCTVLESIGKHEELGKEALLLESVLWSGRYFLLRPAWEFHFEEARRWSGGRPMTDSELNALTFAHGGEWSHNRWLAEPESKGRRVLKIEDRPLLISWTATSDRMTSLLAGPAYLDTLWKDALQNQGVQGALVDAGGEVMIGSLAANAQQAVRTAAATRLPWTLHVTSSDPGSDLAAFAGRRRLLLSGFAVLALVLLAGSYFILRSLERERAVARLQSEFVSAVSHEFRTPLTALRQLSEMLSKGRVPTEEARRQSYDILARESERLQRLVESLLDFGRMEARAVRYHFEKIDPAALVSGVVAEFQEKATARGCRVELAAARDLPFIRADRDALVLVLWNLLDNAVKYSPDCRTVWVGVAVERRRVAIRVRDQGMGIPVAEQKRLLRSCAMVSRRSIAHGR